MRAGTTTEDIRPSRPLLWRKSEIGKKRGTIAGENLSGE
jgi:hypothetical protein